MSLKLAPNQEPVIAPIPARPRSWSLAARLTMWYACSAFALILVASVFLYQTLRKNLAHEEEIFLADRIQDVRDLLGRQPDNTVMLEQEVDEGSRYIQVYLRILDEQGRVVAETPGMSHVLAPRVFPQPVSADAEPGTWIDLVSPQGQAFRGSAAQALTGSPGHAMRVIQAALSQTKKQGLLAKYRRHLWRVLGIALCICALASYQIARRGIHPIQEISQAAQRVRSTTLHQRIPTTGLPAELLTLATIFNEMLTHLEESFSRLSQFSANIAHELRTPVNNLRGVAEVALHSTRSPDEYRDTLGSCLEECLRLSRLIDSLLFLARAEQSQMAIHREPLHIAHELIVVREFYEAAATEAGIPLTVHAPPYLMADLDRTLFQRAVGNLVTNALAYTPRGGTIAFTAAKEQDGIRIEISDTGCGIAAEQLPYVFDRFYRAHPAGAATEPKGMGLGLAIVKSIVTLHGGSITIASELGRGTRVAMTFPALPRQHSALS